MWYKAKYSPYFLLLTLILFSAVPASAVEKNEPALALKIPSIETGEILDLNDYKGKVVYLDFWASWCKPCFVSFPHMQQLHEKYSAQGLQIVAVNLDKDTQKAKQFLAKLLEEGHAPMTFAIGADPKGEYATTYKLTGMPSTYVIDKSGTVRYIHKGFRTGDELLLDKVMAALLSESP